MLAERLEIRASQTSPAWIARHGLSDAAYQREFIKHTQNGYRLIHVSGYGVGNKDFYAAIWEKRSGPAYIARHGMSNATYQKEFVKHTQNGYRLTHISGYGVGNKDLYAAIWEKRSGPAYVARHGMSSATYQKEFVKHTQHGYRLTHVSGYSVGNRDLYAAIWEKVGGNAWAAHHDMTAREYQCQFDNYYYQGYRPKLISGYSTGSARFVAIWESTGAWRSSDIRHIDTTIASFMRENKVDGASVAITKNGRLVFAKGYGYADKAKRERTCATTLFLGASMAKTITAAAIMKLVEQGKLRLSDKVFGTGGILGNAYGSRAYSSAEKAIRVLHLLEHTAGGNEWDNNLSPKGKDTVGDPMFAKSSYDHRQLIGWVLDNRKVDTTPGTQYHYSNFGYCILGRIIEKVTGQSYQSYVRNAILKPADVKRMRIAGRRRWNEVAHDDYSPSLLARMDSHGGWIGSSIDWVRFLVRIDGFATKPDILRADTIKTMTKPSLGNNYAKGLSVDSSDNWWHGGKLGKSRSMMMRTNSGYTWAFQVHGYEGDGSLSSAMGDVIRGVKNWPAHDLF